MLGRYNTEKASRAGRMAFFLWERTGTSDLASIDTNGARRHSGQKMTSVAFSFVHTVHTVENLVQLFWLSGNLSGIVKYN